MASRYNTRRYGFPRLLPDHFKWDGKPKRAYSREAVLMARRRHPDQQPYQCPDCGAWHLGHR